MLKVIEEFPNYSINEYGHVFNTITNIQLKQRKNEDGYYIVNLTKDGKAYHRRCGRLVGLTFLKDSYFDGAVIDHVDHDRSNDYVDNLEWVTPLENTLRSVRINPHLHTRCSVYDETFIRIVCTLIQDGVRNVDIIKNTGITKDALLHLRCGASWDWISKDYEMTPSRKGISEQTAAWVCHKLNEGLTVRDILKLSECDRLSVDIIKKIRNRKSWANVSKHILK